jgi:exopolysaccharide biosynthesis polyprenyl glycosylphosphotransferase
VGTVFAGIKVLQLVGALPSASVTQGMLLSAGALSLNHMVARQTIITLRRLGMNVRKTLIYGAGPVGVEIARRLVCQNWTGLVPIGFLDDDPAKSGSAVTVEGNTLPVLGGWHQARDVIQSRKVQEVIVALPSVPYQHLVDFATSIMSLAVQIRVVPDLFHVISGKPDVCDLGGIPLVGVRRVAIDGFDAAIKRALDVAGAVLGLLAAAPVMLLVALAVRLSSPGPTLFRQERVGENGVPFSVLKFRTMVQDAESRLSEVVDIDALDQPAFKVAGDPRTTSIGRILRRWSLDELPQLINVLKGEMSLVGPRPEEAKVVAKYTYPQRQRLAVKPGLTGPMQVNGRGNLSFDERLSTELNYIRNYTLLLDIEILIKTLPAVVRGRGAY